MQRRFGALAGILAGLFLVLVGAVAGSLLFALLGVLLALIAVAVLSLGRARADRVNDQFDELSPDSRILVRPLKKIYGELEEAASGKSGNISPYMAQEALAESNRLLNQSVAALLLRDRLARDSRGKYDAEKSVVDLQNRLSSAASDEERASLQSALEARKMELSHYDVLKEGIAKIESSVRQAEAAMAEMRARLIASGSAAAADQGSDPLREAVGRMQTLSTSLSEAQEMLRR